MADVVRFKEHPSEMLQGREGASASKPLDPDSTPGYSGEKPTASRSWRTWMTSSAQLQEQLFAESRFGGTKRILLVLQAMDTAGKGGIVKHVMGAMDPQGVQLKSFKAPTPEEKSYDFLWRIEKEVPRGRHRRGL